MAEQHMFTLINSRFTPEEAVPILKGMVEAKLQHHARKVARPGTMEEDMKASETRMKQIESDLRNILRLLRDAAQRGSQVDIEAYLSIKEVPTAAH
jgi:hypothetical protein